MFDSRDRFTSAPKPEALAQQSADRWLALVDSGKYAESWRVASQLSGPYQPRIVELGTRRALLGGAIKTTERASPRLRHRLPGALKERRGIMIVNLQTELIAWLEKTLEQVKTAHLVKP